MTLVKICGITTTADARAASLLGADMLGFNFYPSSPRYIKPELASEIRKNLHGRALAVGVFVNEIVDSVIEIATETKIDIIQLHGNESVEYVEEIKRRTALEILKVFRLSSNADADFCREFKVDAILLDAYSPVLFGGTGELTDWETARKASLSFPKVFLAGGLNPDNVRLAIKTVRPFAVDVASGVEASAGIKDMTKVRDFIRNAREA